MNADPPLFTQYAWKNPYKNKKSKNPWQQSTIIREDFDL